MRPIGFLIFLVSILTVLAPTPATGDDLDKQAWDLTWDRLEAALGGPLPEGHQIHLFGNFQLATWMAPGSEEGNRKLASIAGTIPADSSIWAREGDLFTEYRRIVLDLEIPHQSYASPSEVAKALRNYESSYDRFLQRRDDIVRQCEDRMEQAHAAGRPSGSDAYQDCWNRRKGRLLVPRRSLTTTFYEWRSLLAPNETQVEALHNLHRAMPADGDLYNGEPTALRSLQSGCQEGRAPRTSWRFDRNSSSRESKQQRWGGSAGWGGFLRLGGGQEKLSQTLDGEGSYVELSFCNLAEITLEPGHWFNPTLLRDLESGELRMRRGAVANAEDLDDHLPRRVYKAVVAYNPTIVAHLSQSSYRRTFERWTGSGGIRIGPFSIGGRASGYKESIHTNAATGTIERVLETDYPVILAVVSKPLP